MALNLSNSSNFKQLALKGIIYRKGFHTPFINKSLAIKSHNKVEDDVLHKTCHIVGL